MAPLKPSRPQKRWLYSSHWSKAHDTAFIDMLLYQAERGRNQSNPSKVNKYALDFAAGAVSRGWNWPFQPKTYLWRLERLCTRYITFKAILEMEGFTWDTSKNRIHATKEAWEDILQEMPFADAYIEKDEPKWEKLRKIFEPSPNYEKPVETLNISSGSETDIWSDDEASGDSWDVVTEIVDLVSTDSE